MLILTVSYVVMHIARLCGAFYSYERGGAIIQAVLLSRDGILLYPGMVKVAEIISVAIKFRTVGAEI